MITYDIIFVESAIIAVGGVWGWFHRKALVNRVSAAEAVVQAEEKAIRAKVAAEFNLILNDIRNDEALLTTHAYQIVNRIRGELKQIL